MKDVQLEKDNLVGRSQQQRYREDPRILLLLENLKITPNNGSTGGYCVVDSISTLLSYCWKKEIPVSARFIHEKIRQADGKFVTKRSAAVMVSKSRDPRQ